MSAYLYNRLVNFTYFIGGGWIFISSIIAIFLIMDVAVLISIFKPLYLLKRRAWAFIACVAVLFLELGLLILCNQIFYFFISLAFFAIFCIPLLFIPVRAIKTSKAERNLARYIDGQVRSCERAEQEITGQPLAVNSISEQPIETCREERTEQDEKARLDLDFQHVKNVIAKLEYYPLTTADKKTVRELEDAICQAQAQDFTNELKAKINDGLGALLKIMSRYGV